MAATERDTQPIPISQIDEGTAHIRQQENPERLQELKDSIEKLGLLQPITVVERPKPGPGGKKYSLVIGSRRLKACEQLGWSDIRAVVLPKSEQQNTLAMSLAENMFRVPLKPEETMTAVADLYKQFGRDVKAVARATGMWPETIRRYLRLKEYGTPRMIEWVKKGKISLYDAKRAVEAAKWNITKAEKILERMVNEQMSGPQKRRFADIVDEKPDISVKIAAEETKKPRIEYRLSVELTTREREALEAASEDMQRSPEEIAAQVIREWLKDRRYIE